jgi:hypothetical protein
MSKNDLYVSSQADLSDPYLLEKTIIAGIIVQLFVTSETQSKITTAKEMFSLFNSDEQTSMLAQLAHEISKLSSHSALVRTIDEILAAIFTTSDGIAYRLNADGIAGLNKSWAAAVRSLKKKHHAADATKISFFLAHFIVKGVEGAISSKNLSLSDVTEMSYSPSPTSNERKHYTTMVDRRRKNSEKRHAPVQETETARKKRSKNIKGAVAVGAIAGTSRSVFYHGGNWPDELLKSTATAMWQQSNGFGDEETSLEPSENDLHEWIAVLNNWRSNNKYYNIKRHLQAAFVVAQQVNQDKPDRKKAFHSALKIFG